MTAGNPFVDDATRVLDEAKAAENFGNTALAAEHRAHAGVLAQLATVVEQRIANHFAAFEFYARQIHTATHVLNDLPLPPQIAENADPTYAAQVEADYAETAKERDTVLARQAAAIAACEAIQASIDLYYVIPTE